MGFFKKIGNAFKVGGKFAWKAYNRPEGKVLLSAFVPASSLLLVTAAIETTKLAVGEVQEKNRRDHARALVLAEFPAVAKSGDEKLVNFMIEAKLQELDGNLDVD